MIGVAPLRASAQSSPTISQGQAAAQQNSLGLSAGGQAYVYGFSDGGRYPTTGFQHGELYSLSITDSAGQIADGIAITASNANSFTTNDAAYTIAGAEISGYSTIAKFEGDSGNNPDATTASVTFHVSATDSLTVIVGLASSQSNLVLSGATLSVAAESVVYPGGTDPVEIAYGYLSPGTYTVIETTAPTCTDRCEVGAATDMMGAFVFSPTSTPSSSGSPSSCASMSDQFTTDASLNSAIWTEGTSLLKTYAGTTSSPPSVYVNPILTFSSSGMDVTGASSDYTFTGIQSLCTFSPPIDLTASFSLIASHGATAAMDLVSSDTSSYLRVTGNAEPGAYFPGFWIGQTSGGTSQPGTQLYSTAQLNTEYTLQISVDASGSAVVTLFSQGLTLASASKSIGPGPFYLLIEQSEGAPPASGPNEAVWSSVSLSASSGTISTPSSVTPSTITAASGNNPQPILSIIDACGSDIATGDIVAISTPADPFALPSAINNAVSGCYSDTVGNAFGGFLQTQIGGLFGEVIGDGASGLFSGGVGGGVTGGLIGSLFGPAGTLAGAGVGAGLGSIIGGVTGLLKPATDYVDNSIKSAVPGIGGEILGGAVSGAIDGAVGVGTAGFIGCTIVPVIGNAVCGGAGLVIGAIGGAIWGGLNAALKGVLT